MEAIAPETAAVGTPPAAPTPAASLRRELVGALILVLEPAHLAAGAVALLACVFPLLYAQRVQVPGWTPKLFAWALLTLAAGATCRALGRQVRRRVARWSRPRGTLHTRLRKLFVAHGLATALEPHGPADPSPPGGRPSPFMGYASAPALEQRLRAELRQDPALAASQSQLRRRASLAGLHDGLGAALLAWALLSVIAPTQLQSWPTSGTTSLLAGVVFGLLGLAAWSEAERQEKVALAELVASIAQRVPPA